MSTIFVVCCGSSLRIEECYCLVSHLAIPQSQEDLPEPRSAALPCVYCLLGGTCLARGKHSRIGNRDEQCRAYLGKRSPPRALVPPFPDVSDGATVRWPLSEALAQRQAAFFNGRWGFPSHLPRKHLLPLAIIPMESSPRSCFFISLFSNRGCTHILWGKSAFRKREWSIRYA